MSQLKCQNIILFWLPNQEFQEQADQTHAEVVIDETAYGNELVTQVWYLENNKFWLHIKS
jgi:hypothetical protein